jgi:hypothetical protein
VGRRSATSALFLFWRWERRAAENSRFIFTVKWNGDGDVEGDGDGGRIPPMKGEEQLNERARLESLVFGALLMSG